MQICAWFLSNFEIKIYVFFPGPTSLSYLATKWFLVICGSNLQPFEERVLFVSRISFFSFRQGQHYPRDTTFFAADILSFFPPGPWKYRVFIALFLAEKVEGLFYYFQPGPPLPCNNIWLGNVLHMAVKDNIV